MPEYPTTPFERAVDQAIAQENARFLADPQAIAASRERGDRWRQQMENAGTLPQQGASPPPAISLLWCPVCQLNDRFKNLPQDRWHMSALDGRRCTGRPVRIDYVLADGEGEQ